jgi:peptidoglycan/xylan/chitin deacetylase (PgdA/CDA1 family)
MKVVYLTIDDAPSADFKQKADFLCEQRIPAVFFCQGDLLEKNREAALRAIKQGFILGNHSYDHPHFSSLPLDACFEQIQRTDDILNDLYDALGISWRQKFFRFPYGDKGGLKFDEVFEPYEEEGAQRKAAIQNFLRRLGYRQPNFSGITYDYYRRAGLDQDIDWYWTYDVLEWSIFDSNPLYGVDSLEKVLERMEEVVPEAMRGLNTPGSEEIILTHDHVETTQYFETIINRLLAKGLVFKNIPN